MAKPRGSHRHAHVLHDTAFLQFRDSSTGMAYRTQEMPLRLLTVTLTTRSARLPS
jgi:hypothetical protein